MILNLIITSFRSCYPNEIANNSSWFLRFGVLEFKHGESERGKSIFENIVSNYPRRVDQWNVYIDMAVKGGEVGFARELYDRMADLNLQPKKMKAVFKR